MDKNGYPDEEELKQIETWNGNDLVGLMDYVHDLWHWPDWGWNQDGNRYAISTGGWSGNEDIIAALERNFIFWAMCWQVSRRGGHYEFEIPERLNQ